jgi:hypothetical protein
VFASDDVVFAWVIEKAAWAATYPKKNARHVGVSNDGALKYKLPLKRARSGV